VLLHVLRPELVGPGLGAAAGGLALVARGVYRRRARPSAPSQLGITAPWPPRSSTGVPEAYEQLMIADDPPFHFSAR
jgi:hypothetical protein